MKYFYRLIWKNDEKVIVLNEDIQTEERALAKLKSQCQYYEKEFLHLEKKDGFNQPWKPIGNHEQE